MLMATSLRVNVKAALSRIAGLEVEAPGPAPQLEPMSWLVSVLRIFVFMVEHGQRARSRIEGRKPID